MERRKKGGLNLTTESNKNSTIEARNVKDKINIVKPTKKDRDEKKSSSVSNRTNKSTKTKDYNNNINRLNEDNDFQIKNIKPNEDASDDEGKEKGGDFLYKAMYKTNIDNNKGYTIENMSKPNSQKIQKDKDISNSKENPISQPAGSQFVISMERTDDIHYDIGDKKIHSNIKKSYKYDYKTSNVNNESEESTPQKYNETQNKKTNYNSSSNYERPSSSTYSSKTTSNFVNERTIDLFVIDTDDGEEPPISSKYKKRIDRTRNKIKEIKIEKYDSKTPIRDEKLTGFVLIRKSKGKKIYDVEFEDNIDKINEILKNKKVMIKNEIIQFVTLTKLSNYDRDIKNYTDKISRLQNDLSKKDYSKPRENDNNKINDYEKQISALKSKNQELNKIIFQQQDELDENIREFKQVKLAYDQLKDSIEREKIEREKMEKEKMEKEKEREREQQIKEEPSKIKKKAAQMQLDEDNDQKAIKEMKLRIKKYKDDLKKPDEKNKIPFTYRQDDPSLKGNQSPTKKRHKATIENVQNKDNPPQLQEQAQNPDEDEDDEIGEYVLGDEDAKDPKKRKMKNAVNRFRKKYHEVIKEEKKIQKEKEKEEREREENEERELEDENYLEEKEREEKEERERKEREEFERRERERKEREERERKEREERERKERERKEREERERKERERKERERKEREERERKERERKERERKEREERERRERERKEREEKERKEREKKDIKPAMGGARPGAGKMGVNFSKMLAEKLKMAPPGAMKKGAGAPKVDSKPPVMDKNVDMAKLLEEQPFQGRKDKRKPTRKVFVIEDDNEE